MRQLKRLVPIVGLGAILAGWAMMSGCGEDLVVTVTVPTNDIRADGQTPAEISVVVSRGTAIVEGEVMISTNLGSFTPIVDTSALPNEEPVSGSVSSGEFKAKLYSAQPGEAKITVRFTELNIEGTPNPPVTKTATIKFGSGGEGDIATLEFVSATPNPIQLKGSGGSETSTIIFRAKDKSGGTVPPGLTVKFSLGSALGGAVVEPAEAKTESSGEVRTVLRAGNAVGTVVVKATAGSAAAESERITIAGRAPNHKNFTFSCTDVSIRDGDGVPMDCTAIVADRNNQAAQGVQVTFLSEGGIVERVKTTDEIGRATTTFQTGDPRPADVSVASSYSFLPSFLQNEEDDNVEPSRPCGTGVCNPRDGLNTIVAVTNGEEQWTDENQNGVWDEGEAFVDLPEPFVDVNDNGRYDASDPREKDAYIDANKNGQWDDKNGQWDGATLIWKSYKFIWTGNHNSSQTGLFNRNTLQKIEDTISIPLHGSVTVKLSMVDGNLNMPSTRVGDAITCNCNNEGCLVLAPSSGSYDIHQPQHGRRFFTLTLANTNTPGCELDDPSTCTTRNGSVTCVGRFAHSSQGGETVVTVEHPVTSRAN